MMMPPTIMIGADTIIAAPMKTTVCTWVTSLVLREIRVGAPNRETSWAEKSPTRAKTRRAGRAPGPRRHGRPGRSALMVAAICTSETASIHAAGAEDVAGVALGDALVDDLAVQAGQVERGHGPDELQQHQADDEPAVGPQEVTDESKECHGHARLVTPSG